MPLCEAPNMSGGSSFSIRRAGPHDLNAISSFYRRLFPEQPERGDQAVLKWKFLSQPGDEGVSMFILEENGDIHGVIGYVSMRLNLPTGAVRICEPMDYFVDARYRGLPALRLLHKVLNLYPATIGANFSPDARRLITKVGFDSLDPYLRSCYFPLCGPAIRRRGWALRSMRPLTGRLKVRARLFWSTILRTVLRCFPAGHVRHVTRDTLDLQFIPFCDRLADGQPGIAKDTAYLRWRYAQSPLLNCRFVHQTRDGNPTGLAIVHFDDQNNSAVLLDVVVDRSGNASATSLILAIIDYCNACGRSLLTTSMLDQHLMASLKLCGFGDTQGSIGFMTYSKDEHIKKAMQIPSLWNFVVGNTDVY